jgi:hypothetical protein
LILLGLYFLADQLNLALPGLGQLWPGFVILGGLFALLEYASGEGRDSGQLFTGIASLLIGAFLFLFTLNLPLPLAEFGDGVGWTDMGKLWPVFVLIGGLAALGQWLAEPGNHSARNLSLAAFVVGLIALTITLNLAGGTVLRQLVRFWPLLLVAAGLQMLLQRYRRRRQE